MSEPDDFSKFKDKISLLHESVKTVSEESKTQKNTGPTQNSS